MTAPQPLVVCIAGPTATGKTALALELAERADVALISVDSAMVYRGMDIGTAKPDADTLVRHPHALIDVRPPETPFSAADFLQGADAAVRAALRLGKLPLLVGGTMLYFKAFRDGLAKLPSAAAGVRERIEEEARRLGWPALHARLKALDPSAGARIHPNDPQRIQRALEVYETTGRSISAWQSTPGAALRQRLGCRVLAFALDAPQQTLARRIATRFDAMLERGFVEEVRHLRERPGLSLSKPSMRAVGYRQLWQHLSGDCDLPAAREAAIAATRQLARRQRTWLRGWLQVVPLAEAPEQAAEAVLRRVEASA